jgi:hypothetical protein
MQCSLAVTWPYRETVDGVCAVIFKGLVWGGPIGNVQGKAEPFRKAGGSPIKPHDGSLIRTALTSRKTCEFFRSF